MTTSPGTGSAPWTRTQLDSGHHVIWNRPAGERDGTDLVVVIHGYGSNELRAAQGYFSMLPEGVTGLAVRGGFEIDAAAAPVTDGPVGDGSGPGGPDPGAWGWFLLDYFLANDFADVISAANSVRAWISSVREQHSSVTLMGYSQGMAMATTLLRLHPEDYRAVVGLSGFVLKNELLSVVDSFEAKPPFFWGRDKADLVINEDAIAYTAEWLEQNTLLTPRTYPGMGHAMSKTEMADVSAFLRHYVLR